jgi:hypothetical protein
MTDNTCDLDQSTVTVENSDGKPLMKAQFNQKWKKTFFHILFATLIFGSGLGSGYFIWGQGSTQQAALDQRIDLLDEINPKEGYAFGVKYGEIGPALLNAGAIDFDKFRELYLQAGQPLSEKEIEILAKGSQDIIVINRENAHFLLNFFWALGLTNKNPILESGPIQQVSEGQIDRFASTGGWMLGKKPVTELFSNEVILALTDEQQAKVEEVANAVFRPCCNNPTSFPDCNHGMAMLGLLELLASQDATTDEMFQVAKYANAFWFPDEALEHAIFFKAAQNIEYQEIDAKLIVSREYSSISGFQNMHQWLSENGLLEQTPQSGSSCGV